MAVRLVSIVVIATIMQYMEHRPLKVNPLRFRVHLFCLLQRVTLIIKDPWPPIYEQADQALVQVFQRAGVPLEVKAFSSEFETFLDCYYAERGASPIEKTTFSALQELLQKKGFMVLRIQWFAPPWMPCISSPSRTGISKAMPSQPSKRSRITATAWEWSRTPPMMIMFSKWWIVGTSSFFELIVTSAGVGFRSR